MKTLEVIVFTDLNSYPVYLYFLIKNRITHTMLDGALELNGQERKAVSYFTHSNRNLIICETINLYLQ